MLQVRDGFGGEIDLMTMYRVNQTLSFWKG